MTLPARIRKEPKRASRWRSQAHLNFVRSFACCACGSTDNIQAAHIRNGSGAGISQKPDDFRAVSLCGPQHDSHGCHRGQHLIGEATFWGVLKIDPEALIEEFICASPKRREIEAIRKERRQ